MRILLGRGSGGFAEDFYCLIHASFLACALIRAPRIRHRPEGHLFSVCAQLVEAIVGQLEGTAGRWSIYLWFRRLGVMDLRIALRLHLPQIPHCPYQPVDRAPLLYHAEPYPS